ncbi:MAG: hypothetical protein AAF488_16335 [Planctomycetota bacterium]
MNQPEASENAPFWAFDFVLESEDGAEIPESVATELLEHIGEWVMAKGLQIGGGYAPGELDDDDRLPQPPLSPFP